MGLRDFFVRRGEKDRPVEGAARPFGFAVVGLGSIAGYMLDALRDAPGCRVTAVVSGNKAKAAAVAAKYDAAATYTYDDFDRMRDNPDVDAVYLALPVGMHRAYTERAAAAGKHVLCEKPMASTAADARAMIDACRRAGVLLSIAYRCPHDPVHLRLRSLLAGGALGRLHTIESGFGFPLDRGWRTEGALAGGGSLYDVGIYPLNAARFLLAAEPVAVEDGEAVCDGQGLERSITWTSVFPGGVRALCRSSYREKIADTLRVTGDGGSLLLGPAFSHRERFRLQGEITVNGRRVRIDERTPRGLASHFRLEAEALMHAARGGEPLVTPGEDGLADMVAIEAIYAAAGVAIP